MPIHDYFSRGLALAASGSVLFLAACKERPIAVYSVPKEKAPAPKDTTHNHAPGESHEDEEAPLPRVSWTLPAGWKDMGGETADSPIKAVGRFAIEGTDATVNITPLGSFSGKEPMLVNMWRSVLGQADLSDEDAAKALTQVPVAGGTGKIFDLTGEQRGQKARIVTAMFNHSGRSWFFKLQGTPEAVEPQVAAFKQFLTTIKFEDAGSDPSAPLPTPAPVAPKPAPAAMKAPEGWTAVAPGPMQVAKFTVPEKDGGKAEVTVSIFPNDTGGALANINRWRGQVGLPETNEAGLKECTSELDAAIPGSILADLKGEKKMMLGAIVPKDGQWYFFKLTGDVPAVSAARESFVSFARTAK